MPENYILKSHIQLSAATACWGGEIRHSSFRILNRIHPHLFFEIKNQDMTTIQLNAEIYEAFSIIAKDESLLTLQLV